MPKRKKSNDLKQPISLDSESDKNRLKETRGTISYVAIIGCRILKVSFSLFTLHIDHQGSKYRTPQGLWFRHRP